MNPQQILTTIEVIRELFPESWVNDWKFALTVAKCLGLITETEYWEIKEYLKHTP